MSEDECTARLLKQSRTLTITVVTFEEVGWVMVWSVEQSWPGVPPVAVNDDAMAKAAASRKSSGGNLSDFFVPSAASQRNAASTSPKKRKETDWLESLLAEFIDETSLQDLHSIDEIERELAEAAEMAIALGKLDKVQMGPRMGKTSSLQS